MGILSSLPSSLKEVYAACSRYLRYLRKSEDFDLACIPNALTFEISPRSEGLKGLNAWLFFVEYANCVAPGDTCV